MGRFTNEKRAAMEAEEQRKRDSLQGTVSETKEDAGGTPSPASGKPLAELKTEYAEARAEKKRSHNKKKAPDADLEKREAFLSGFVLFSGMALKLICARMPNPLEPTQEESEMWNTAVTAVMGKYFSSFASWDAELSLCIAAVFIFLPRMKKEKTDAESAPGNNDFGKNGDGQDGTGKVPD